MKKKGINKQLRNLLSVLPRLLHDIKTQGSLPTLTMLTDLIVTYLVERNHPAEGTHPVTGNHPAGGMHPEVGNHPAGGNLQ